MVCKNANTGWYWRSQAVNTNPKGQSVVTPGCNCLKQLDTVETDTELSN